MLYLRGIEGRFPVKTKKQLRIQVRRLNSTETAYGNGSHGA